MGIKNYISFLKWYFNYIGNERFDNASRRSTVKRKERLPLVILSYIVMICSLLCFFIIHNYYVLFLTLISFMLLHGCRFSFLGYFIAYIKFKNKDKSINDNAIFTYGVLDGGESELLSTVKKHFNFFVVGGNIFSVKILLTDKGKKQRKEYGNEKKILKITPSKIYLNNKVIFDNKLLDVSDLEIFLSELSQAYRIK